MKATQNVELLKLFFRFQYSPRLCIESRICLLVRAYECAKAEALALALSDISSSASTNNVVFLECSRR